MTGHVYLCGNIQGSGFSGYEAWDVTNVTNPKLVERCAVFATRISFGGMQHGIAYMPGSKNEPTGSPADGARASRWSSPTGAIQYNPQYIRTFGLPGGQPVFGRTRLQRRFTARSPHTSIQTLLASWRAAPRRTT